MGRPPCCHQESGVKKGPWTPEEDKLLVDYIRKNGHSGWRRLSKLAGLNRCGKSCRLRWTNYLRPDIKRGCFTDDEEKLVIQLHSMLGNKWSSIASKLPGRTDNDIKNYWNTHLRKKLLGMGIDPVSHRPNHVAGLLPIPNLGTGSLAAVAMPHHTTSWDINTHQLLQGLVSALELTTSAAPSVDLRALLAGGVDQGTSRVHYEGLLNLPALTTVSPGMSCTSLLAGSLLNGAGGDLAGDGLSSTELEHGGTTCWSHMTAAAVVPPTVVAAEECNVGSCNGTTSACEVTPASSSLEGLENLDRRDDLNNNDSLKDLLEQMSWFNSNEM